MAHLVNTFKTYPAILSFLIFSPPSACLLENQMAIISACASTSCYTPPSGGEGRPCKYTGQSVRALPIRIITVGKKRSAGVQLLVEEYTKKLKNYCSLHDLPIRSNPRNARDEKAQVDDEDKAVMNLIRSDDWVVLLDEHGRDIGSEQMAELIGDAGNTGASRLSFCIGGPYGHGQQIRKRANISIRLSSMVLNHQIALLVLVEQLYRSWTILKGQNYHH
ncbi:PREDICTED: putative RNA methyltransferase At5g10620 isoform X2 [Populus euphratica]|uniref:RNA methyltransferase At5g10620 isoform X2 n=1 Tax=Populus euphratica TaxID=75702 RepID=A0AAJ6X5Z5_POPEU|nr:PREDICTED: putative RNA methyltransferase At5g10620 isoform X2 [Populus euphratica]